MSWDALVGGSAATARFPVSRRFVQRLLLVIGFAVFAWVFGNATEAHAEEADVVADLATPQSASSSQSATSAAVQQGAANDSDASVSAITANPATESVSPQASRASSPVVSLLGNGVKHVWHEVGPITRPLVAPLREVVPSAPGPLGSSLGTVTQPVLQPVGSLVAPLVNPAADVAGPVQSLLPATGAQFFPGKALPVGAAVGASASQAEHVGNAAQAQPAEIRAANVIDRDIERDSGLRQSTDRGLASSDDLVDLQVPQSITATVPSGPAPTSGGTASGGSASGTGAAVLPSSALDVPHTGSAKRLAEASVSAIERVADPTDSPD